MKNFIFTKRFNVPIIKNMFVPNVRMSIDFYEIDLHYAWWQGTHTHTKKKNCTWIMKCFTFFKCSVIATLWAKLKTVTFFFFSVRNLSLGLLAKPSQGPACIFFTL